MIYFVTTVSDHIRTRIKRFQEDAPAGRKMIFTIPAMQESAMLAIAEAIANACLQDPTVKLNLKIARRP